MRTSSSFALLFFTLSSVFLSTFTFEIEDLHIPADCESVVKAGDHLLLEYSLLYENGTSAHSLAAPSSLLHTIVLEADDLAVNRGLKGMCKNATRKISWTGEQIDSVWPLETPSIEVLDSITSVVVTIVHLTEPEDFEIFKHLRDLNASGVHSMLSQRRGALAVNEFGESPLMITVQREMLSSFSYVINARRPMIDINFAKSSGHTVLFMAISLKTTSMLKALLQRGADPTVTLKMPGSEGSTPLHFACAFEKKAVVELLLQYGADPNAVNANGLTPLELLPRDAMRSTKLQFKNMFEAAANKEHAPEVGSSARRDL